MADSKKYNGSTWEHSLRKLATATDTFTTLPADLYADGNNATVGLQGNMVQSGTPTPDNPIQPQECGEMSSNLFDITAFVQGIVPNRCTTSYDSTTNTLTINATGDDAHTGNNNTYHIPVTGGKTYTLSWTTSSQGGAVYIFENGLTNSSHLHDWNSSLNRGTVTMRNDTTFIIVRVGCNSANVAKTYTNIRLNVGKTALPYDKYGQYKIPISSANTTTPVYLGEVETTRRIGKYVFKGTENWYDVPTNGVYYTNVVKDLANKNNYSLKCSHFKLIPQTTIANLTDGSFTSDNNVFFWFKETSITSLADWKAWLAQQYANGTPVCVWYVLATETRGIINEPLRKIGDYADTVSGISIPTITGKDTFDVLTTLKPSEVSLSYTGWHDASAKEWDGSEWQ